MTRSVTKSLEINAPAGAVFEFANDPGNLPKWAVHNVRSARLCGDGIWELETPRGTGRFIPHERRDFGILDHEFIDPLEGHWMVPARVVEIGPSTSVYMITLCQPSNMPDEAFAQGMKLMDDELNALKAAVEARVGA